MPQTPSNRASPAEAEDSRVEARKLRRGMVKRTERRAVRTSKVNYADEFSLCASCVAPSSGPPFGRRPGQCIESTRGRPGSCLTLLQSYGMESLR